VSRRELDPHDVAKRIEAELEKLARIAEQPAASADLSGLTPWRDLPGFWQKAREISELFRTSDLIYEDRTRLWQRHQQLCDGFSKLRIRERRIREDASKATRNQVMSILDSVRQAIAGANSAGELATTGSTLDRAMLVMKESFLLRQDREECWKAWRSADRALSARRQKYSAEPQKRKSVHATINQTVELLCGMRDRKVKSRDKLQCEIDQLQADISRSWKLEWANRARGWVQERRVKIDDLGKEIDELERQIQVLKGGRRLE
jgi:hypothetical protein